MSSSEPHHPGRAVLDDSYARKDGRSLVRQSEAVTAGLIELLRENEGLKEKLFQLEQECSHGAFG